MSEKIIKLQNVSKFYSTNGVVALGLRGIDLEFSLGEFVIITGASGSGKTTLLNVIAGMDSYQEGKMFFNGEDTSYFGHLDYAKYRRDNICFVFQHYNLIESYTVYQNVLLAMTIKGASSKTTKREVKRIIERVGLSHRMNYRVSKLSGGEKQRVAIARALASSAPIIACDEITGNLDSKTSNEILQILKEISKEKLVLLVTHDPEEAIEYASRSIRLFDGGLAEDKILKKNIDVYEYEKPVYRKPRIKDVFKVTSQMVLQTPKRALFVVLALFLSFIFITNNYGSIGINLSDFSYNDYYSSIANSYDERIILKKTNNTPFSENEITALKNKNYVKDVIINDYVLDLNAIFSFDSGYGYYYSSYYLMRPMSTVEARNLTAGKMPTASNEILAYKTLTSYNELELDKEYDVQYGNKTLKLKVVGIIDNSTEIVFNNVIFVTNALLETLIDDAFISFTSFSITTDENALYKIDNYFPSSDIFVKLDESSEYDLIYTQSFDEYLNNVVVDMVTLGFENAFMSKKFENCKVLVKYDNLEDRDVIVKPIDKVVEPYFFSSFAKIEIKDSMLQQVVDNRIYQVTLNVDKEEIDKAVIDLELRTDFIVYPLFYTKTDNFGIIMVIFGIITTVFAVVSIGVIFIIVYFALRRIMTSSRNDFQILRSLGANNRWIKNQLYIENFIYINLAFILYVGVILIIKSLPSSIYLTSFQNIDFFDFVKIYGIVLLLGLFLSVRYYQRLFKLSIVSRELE